MSFEDKFSKLGEDRNNWLLSGEDMLVSPDYTVDAMSSKFNNRLELAVKRINKENESFKSVVLSSVDHDSLPSFRAGQRIAVTFLINGKYITRPFSICSSNAEALDGEYKILIYSNPDDILLKEIYDGIKVGDRVMSSAPFGNFYYNELRDSKNVIAIVSDLGIAPIYSMIQAIISKEEDFNLTLFYSVKKYSDLLFVDELREYDDKSNKVKVFFVLSEEEREGCLNGFVDKTKLREVMKEYNSFFIAGGEGLLKYLNKELEEFKLPKKYVRYDDYLPKCNIRKIVEFKLVIYINGERYETSCFNNRTIMDSITESGIFIPSKCHNGSCGYCNSELVLGKVKVVNDKRSTTLKEHNIIHPCCTYPLSDIEIIVR
jgi:ferredoxin-NADP reductase